MTKLEILESFALYRDAPPPLKAAMARTAGLARLEPGTYFFHEGDVCDHLALPGAGDLRIHKTGESGREITLYHVRAAESCLVNGMSVLLGLPCPAAALVEATVEAVVFPAQAVRGWVAVEPGVRSFFFESMASRLVAVMTLVEEITFRKADVRLARVLLDRFEEGGRLTPEIAVTHDQIAREMGTAREVVSRLLKEMERMGAIEMTRGRVSLKDAGILRSLRTRW